MKMARFLAALALLPSFALAQATQPSGIRPGGDASTLKVTPPGAPATALSDLLKNAPRVGDDGTVTILNGPTLGTFANGRFTARPGALVLPPTDQGSSGDVSGMSVPVGADTLGLGQTLPALMTTRAGIAQRRIDPKLGSFVVTGNVTAGDGGAGARYVPGRGYREIQDAAGTWWRLDLNTPVVPAGWAGVVAGDASAAAANGVAFNALLAAVGDVGGGVIEPPLGLVYTDRSIDIRYDNVMVRCKALRTSHDTGSARPGTTFVPTAAVTVLRHRTPTAAERGVSPALNHVTTGGGFDGCAAVGNGLAPRLLRVTSVRYGTHRLYLDNAIGTEAALYDVLGDPRVVAGQTQEVGEAADNQHNSIDIEFRQGDSTASRGADGVVFDGLPNGGNTSINFGIRITGRHADGHGVRIVNADNMVFETIRTQVVGGGTGKSILVQAMPPGVVIGGIIVNHLTGTGGSKVETLAERPGATALSDLRILSLDSGNATPLPTGPNVFVDDTGFAYGFSKIGTTNVFAATGSGVAQAKTARQILDTYIAGGNGISEVVEGAHVRFSGNGSGVRWLTRVDGENLQIQAIGGSAPLFQIVSQAQFLNGIFSPFVLSKTAGDGVRVGAYARTADPTTTDIPQNQCASWNNTTAGTYKHVCNFGGVLRSVSMN